MHTWSLRDRVLSLERCLVMGIVNVTPDSFSDGGRYAQTEQAIARARELLAEGADIIDVGGESTRPGSRAIALDEELRRVVPVVEATARQPDAVVSVDTSKAEVACACLDAGAQIINDVTGLTGDSRMVEVVRANGAGVILMHMQGTPETMQIAPVYADVVVDIYRFFEERLQSLARAALDPDRIVLDPGIGFGKTLAHNLELLANLDRFQALGRPVCLGVSRKGILGKVLDRPVTERLAGALAVAGHALARGAVQVLRVHDVAATRDLVRMWQTLEKNRSSPGTPAASGTCERPASGA
jgi:dihydropteroate synthase